MSPIDHRIERFKELISKGKYYHLMNFNLFVLRRSFRNGKWVKLNEDQISILEIDKWLF